MGARDRLKKAPTIHRQSFESKHGKSVRQYHSDHAFPPDAKCLCGRRPMIRAIVMIPLAELRKRDPEYDQAVAMAQINPKLAETFFQTLVQLTGADGKPENYIRVSTTYSCESCKKDFEKALAKAPSWAAVDIHYGPPEEKIFSTSS